MPSTGTTRRRAQADAVVGGNTAAVSPLRATLEDSFGPLRGVSDVELARLDAIVHGIAPMAERARDELAPLIETEAFRKLPSKAKLTRIKAAFNSVAGELVASDAAVYQAGRRATGGTVGSARHVADFDFQVSGFDRTRDARKQDVTVDGRVISVFSPKSGRFATRGGAKELVSHTLEDIEKALSLLQPSELLRIKQIHLSPVPNPEDTYWARLYDDPNLRSYLNAGADGVITIFPWPHSDDKPSSPRDLAVAMSHELGHVVSLRRWGTGRGAGRDRAWQRWQEAAQKDGVWPSRYARSSLEEDFAEMQALRKLTSQTPYEPEVQALFVHRMAILRAQFP